MRKNLVPLIFFLVTSFANATEIEVQSTVSNIYFSTSRDTTTAGLTFEGKDLYWGNDFSLTQDLGEGLTIKTGYATDIPLRRKVFADLTYRYSNLTFSVGPYFGTWNTLERWFLPGLSAAFQMDFPGVLYYKLGFTSTLSPLGKSGDYYMSGEFASVGVFLPNGIVSGTIEYKGFQTQSTASLNISDEVTSYLLSTEIFAKNFPLRYTLNLKYQTLSRTYQSNTTLITSLNSFIMGNCFHWDIDAQYSLLANVEASLFNFSSKDTIYALPSDSVLYSFQLGLKVKI